MLINDQATLEKFMPVKTGIAFELFEEYLFAADTLFVLDSTIGIGRPLYEVMIASELTDNPGEVQKLLRHATACYAYTLWAPEHAVNHDEMGITVSTGENVAPVSDSKLQRLIETRHKLAYSYLEKAYELMEEKRSDFTDWTGSGSYVLRKKILVSSVKEFEEYYHIDTSRVRFNRYRSGLAAAEREKIAPELGEQMYLLLKAEYQAGSLTEKHQRLLPAIQACAVHYALYMEALGADKPKAYTLEHKRKMEMYAQSFTEKIRANIEDYPLFPNQQTFDRMHTNDNEDQTSQFLFN